MSEDADSPDASTELAHLVGEFIFWFAIVLATVWCGRRWWLLFQGIMTVGIALMSVISPHFTYNNVMKSLIGDFDEYHEFSIRIFALLYLIYGLKVLYCRNSTDNRAVSALMEGLCLAYALETVCHVTLWARKPVGKPAHYPEKGIPFFIACMLGNFLHLTVGQTGYNDFRNQSSNLNARFDALALFIIGGSVYAYTKDILIFMTNKTDFGSAHVGAMTVAGCYMLSSALISLQAEVFTRETMRMLYLCRIFESTSLIALILSYLLFSDILATTSLWAVLMYGVLAGNALVAMKKLRTKSKE